MCCWKLNAWMIILWNKASFIKKGNLSCDGDFVGEEDKKIGKVSLQTKPLLNIAISRVKVIINNRHALRARKLKGERSILRNKFSTKSLG